MCSEKKCLGLGVAPFFLVAVYTQKLHVVFLKLYKLYLNNNEC